MGLHFGRRLQRQVAQLVRRVLAIAVAAADGQVLELVIAGEEVRRIGRNRPDPFGQLEPVAFDEL